MLTMFILITIISYFILAIVNIVDKFVLGNVVPNSKAYTFFVGILGALVVFVGPWYLVWPGISTLLISIFVGALFPIALTFMYKSLKVGDTSRMIKLLSDHIRFLTIFFKT